MATYLPLEADRLLDLSIMEFPAMSLPGPAEVLTPSLPEPLVDRNYVIRKRWTELWSPPIAECFRGCLVQQMLVGMEALHRRVRALAICQPGRNAGEEKLFSDEVAQAAFQELAATSELQGVLRAFLCSCCCQSRLYRTADGLDEYFRRKITTLSQQSPYVIAGVLNQWQWSSKFRQAIMKDLEFMDKTQSFITK